MMKVLYSFLCLYLCFYVQLKAQNCGCTHQLVAAKNTITFDGNLQTPKVKAGDVLCIPSGTYKRIIIKNVVGTAQNPVIIKNCNGQAFFSNPDTLSNPILMMQSKYFKFTGTGDDTYLYGIQISGGSSGMSFAGNCTNFEVDHIEIYKTGFAGIMAKTDPNCSDPLTWRENFTMYNVSLHHNYVHDVDGEGFYVGNSFFNSVGPGTSTCGGKSAHSIDGVDIYRNIVKRTGCEGIQVGSAPKNCKIHDNVVDTTGINPFANFQNNGLQIGGGTGGMLYNNWMNYCPGNGISCLGIGDNLIFNNIILHSGADTAKLAIGIFMDEQNTQDSLLGSGMKFINNTIINPRTNGIRIYTDRLPMSYIQNNIIVQYGTNPEYVRKLNASVLYKDEGNVYRNSLSALNFVDPANRDYRLKSNSPAKGAGVNVSVHGVTFDFNNYARIAPYDAGAFAYNSPKPVVTGNTESEIKEIKASTYFVYPNPINISEENISLSFYLNKQSDVKIQAYDLQGKFLNEVEAIEYPAGWNTISISKSFNQTEKGALLFRFFENGVPKDSQIVLVK